MSARAVRKFDLISPVPEIEPGFFVHAYSEQQLYLHTKFCKDPMRNRKVVMLSKYALGI